MNLLKARENLNVFYKNVDKKKNMKLKKKKVLISLYVLGFAVIGKFVTESDIDCSLQCNLNQNCGGFWYSAALSECDLHPAPSACADTNMVER